LQKWIILLFVLSICIGKSYSAFSPPGKSREAADDPKNYDTTYKIGSYLICAAKWMKYDVINRHHPDQVIKSKGDTLYKDKDTVILGDKKGMAKYPATFNILMDDSANLEGIYKRFLQRYDFSKFKVDHIYTGKLADPDFKTDPGAKYYKTMIRQNGYLNLDFAKKNNKVDFAGHYTVIKWSQQGITQFIAIVDRTNGKVCHRFPFGVFKECYSVDYKTNSNMFINNSDLLSLIPGYSLLSDDVEDYAKDPVVIYVWKGDHFVKLE